MNGGGGGVGLEVRLEAGRHLSLALPCSGPAVHPAPPYPMKDHSAWLQVAAEGVDWESVS